MMKRIAAVSVIFLLLFNISVYADVTYTKQEQDDYYERVRMLSAFGVFDSTVSYDISATISRVNLSKMIVKLMGYDASGGQVSAFSDITEKSDGIGAIGVMASLGYLKGFEDGTFRPNDLITYEQALKIFVSMLGYDYLANKYGGYPSGYIQAASEIKIMKGVEGYKGYPLTYFNLTKMIVNSLEVDFMVKTSYGGTEQFEIIKGSNILADQLKLEKRRGIIHANEYTSLTEAVSPSKGYLVIDNQKYAVNFDYNSYIGCRVDFYVNNDNENDLKIIFVKKPDSLNDILTINGEDIDRYQGRTYYYNLSKDKTETVDVPASAYVIYNGKIVSAYQDEDMMPTSGVVKLIDNNSDGAYDVVNIVRYEHFVVNSVDSRKQIVYDKYDSSKSLQFDENDAKNYLSINDTTGKRLTVDGLKEWDILSVAASKDNRYVVIHVSRDTVQGDISEITYKDDKADKLKVNDKEYTVHKDFKSDFQLKLSGFGTFYLNKDGEITTFKMENAPNSGYGFLIKTSVPSTGLEKRVEFKLLDSENNMRYLKSAKTVKIDEINCKNSDEVMTNLKKGAAEVNPQLIKFKLNASDELSQIDTAALYAANDDSNEFRVLYSCLPGLTELMYRGNHMTFRGKVNISSKTVMFKVPAPSEMETAEDEDFSVIRTNYFKHDFEYAIEAYSESQNRLIADALITFENASQNTDPKVGAVNSIVYALNKNGDNVIKLELITYMGKEEVYTENEDMVNAIPADNAPNNTYKLEVGDVVSFNQNSNSKLTSLKLLMDVSAGNFTSNDAVKFSNAFDYLAMDRMYYGHVYDMEDDVVALSRSTDFSAVPVDLETHKLTGYKILLLDTTLPKPRFINATSKDIFDYKHSKQNYSNVFLFTEYADQRLMVIYR